MCTSCSERVQNIISVQQRGGLFGHLSVIPFRFLLRLVDGMIDWRAMGTRRRATACARLPDLRYGTSMRVVLQALGVIRPHPKASILILVVLLLLGNLDSRRFCRGFFTFCILPIIHDFIRDSGGATHNSARVLQPSQGLNTSWDIRFQGHEVCELPELRIEIGRASCRERV